MILAADATQQRDESETTFSALSEQSDIVTSQAVLCRAGSPIADGSIGCGTRAAKWTLGRILCAPWADVATPHKVS